MLCRVLLQLWPGEYASQFFRCQVAKLTPNIKKGISFQFALTEASQCSEMEVPNLSSDFSLLTWVVLGPEIQATQPSE